MIKTGRLVAIVAFLSIILGCATAKDGEPVKRTAFIQTNAICGECKERIEGILNFEKGIIYAELNLDNKKVEVKYNSKKTSIEKIRETISKIGYQADDIAPDKEAQENLPACCQPGGEPHD